MKKKLIISISMILLVMTFITTLMIVNVPVVEALSKYGSRGQEVKTIQDKLNDHYKSLGMYP